VVVRRPLLVGGEVEGMGRLKGDLDLVGEELLGELHVHNKDGRNNLLVVVISSSSSRESSVRSRNRNWAGRIGRVEYRWGRTS